ncbi:MAG: Radical SAM domain protein [Candidatus Shapirobacteria bacterium GW2011_GWE1_38_10]|uniref:Radical SAM domain protein n=1 Tax=Candidatus Shapirobacteria bacterium GW2011_GWE1_38_10 TaxID=1618488 RepID=A0A0G0I1T8_9BACT|nr:MAG: Radical SAM domain protein [Candidatus Shapirobacteria bacterium GW2011_GWF2_37_20]KKQ48547.1 MAG: Radical SAM domain protein [Candidatus Shapirobacteria bacterium GW2011_GWE1_38_10]
MKKVILAANKKYSISISYPPLDSPKGIPFLAQNRQFQWTNTGNVILPVIPAYGATALKKLGYKIYWDDAIAEKNSYKKWLNRLKKRCPNIIFIESKTPVIKKHWLIINEIKKVLPKSLVVLMGDHLTALPEESFDNSRVDYVITGGDYDFMMLNLADHITNGTKLEPGFYYRFKNKVVNTGIFALKHHNLDTIPIIDRQLTKWKLYGNNNTNFKYKPGAYIMSGRDCWWGKCTFCSWVTTHPFGTFRTFSVEHTIKEIEYLVSLGIKEIFDDAGTLPIGPWLNNLCHELIKRGLNKKVVLGCNMRFGALTQAQYDLMAKAGFRFILYGLESSSSRTLKLIKKNTLPKDARKTLVMAKKAGLQPHVTIMIGYPWEKLSDAQRTLKEARHLFKDGLADSMQATIVIPYPGTSLFAQCQKNNWLLTQDWNDYDMRQPVMKSPIKPEIQLKLVRELFYGILTPNFIWRKITSIRNIDDIKYLATYAIKYLQKLRDFPDVNEKK